MSKYTNEIEKRRTFAIISHPDAGKTTLTEKFLLYGGAINLAGSVKGKATARHAVSSCLGVRTQTTEGPYFNGGSKDTGVPPSKPPAYPTHRLPKFNVKL